MARKVDRDLWDAWRRRVERQRQSGLAIAEYCRQEGISQPSFFARKRQLRSGSQPTRKSSPTHRRLAPVQAQAVVPRQADFLRQLPVLAMRSSPWVELTLVDGTVVRVPQQNLAVLTIVLRILRGEDVTPLMGGIDHA